MKKIMNWLRNLDRKKQLIILTVLLLTVNLILMMGMSFGYGTDLSGQLKSPEEVENAGLRTLIFGFPLLSIILGSILSLFLTKKKTHKERFINSSLILLICFYFIFLFLGLRNLILW